MECESKVQVKSGDDLFFPYLMAFETTAVSANLSSNIRERERERVFVRVCAIVHKFKQKNTSGAKWIIRKEFE